jgi:hypothetical protein
VLVVQASLIKNQNQNLNLNQLTYQLVILISLRVSGHQAQKLESLPLPQLAQFVVIVLNLHYLQFKKILKDVLNQAWA